MLSASMQLPRFFVAFIQMGVNSFRANLQDYSKVHLLVFSLRQNNVKDPKVLAPSE
jgi:hypothetical protein